MEKIDTDKVIRDITDSLLGIAEDIRAIEVKRILEMHLGTFQIFLEETTLSTYLDCNEDFMRQYLLNMKLNGNTNSSIKAYMYDLKAMLVFIDKAIRDIKIGDLRTYLANGKINKKWSDRTYNTKLIIIRCFFNWLYEEDLVEQNPAKKLKETKVEHRMGNTLTPEQREMVRCSCMTERELAICDLLYTSGIRVSELCGLNRQDIDFQNMKAVVFGKGRKEREIYFSGQAKVHLQKYLAGREDDNEALFISTRKPYARLSADAIRAIINKVKERNKDTENIKLTPHVYRRTLGTDMINRGAPIELVKEVLGHEKVDTTLQYYAAMSKETVKRAHAVYA